MADDHRHQLWLACERHRARGYQQIEAVKDRHTDATGHYVDTPKTRALIAYLAAATDEACALMFPDEEEWLNTKEKTHE